MALNGINLGLFKISFSTFLLGEPNCTETDLKKSQICPIWGKFDPIRMANLTSLQYTVFRMEVKSVRFVSMVAVV